MQHCSNSIANALELLQSCTKPSIQYFNGLMQKRHNSSALAMELCLFRIKPSIWWQASQCADHSNYFSKANPCMVQDSCLEFHNCPLEFHTKYLTHTLKEVYFIKSEILRAQKWYRLFSDILAPFHCISIMAWMSNHIHVKLGWCNSSPMPNFTSNLFKLPLNIRT